jgi:hypothetical protein
MITYTAKSQYVDVETGEIISKKNAMQNYIIIRTTKRYNNEEIMEKDGYRFGKSTIEYTRECEKRRQLKLQL